MFKKMSQGEQVAMQKTSGRKITLTIAEKEELDYSQNVIAMVEGTDPVLKNEYIVYSAHYDHLPLQRGRVYNGADDNGSGTVDLPPDDCEYLSPIDVHEIIEAAGLPP